VKGIVLGRRRLADVRDRDARHDPALVP
jgi:hypothetical protein